jgi:hypothetical protein
MRCVYNVVYTAGDNMLICESLGTPATLEVEAEYYENAYAGFFMAVIRGPVGSFRTCVH